MRRIVLTLAALAWAGQAAAQSAISGEIGQNGIAATAQRLETLANPSDDERFALAGLRFLGGVERAFQLRWRHGLTDRTGMLPFLRMGIGDNPAPEPFVPDLIATLFDNVTADMEAARAPLAEIYDTSEFGLEIDLGDLWFDVNASGVRDPGEDLLDIAGPVLLGWQWTGRDPAAPTPVIRFDTADAAWLAAYTHALQAVAELVLAYDPTEAIAQVGEAKAAMASLAPMPFDEYGMTQGIADFADIALIVIRALNQEPGEALMRSAHGHILAMVAQNRIFWERVVRETDDSSEWIPNARQVSGLGIALPPETGEVWQGVLTEVEAMLNGKLLVPYWRLGDGAGVDVGRMFTEPRAIDLLGWIQGADAVPYLEQGPLMTGGAWARFESLMGGEAMLFTAFLN
jgi:hypothetical protein